MRSDAVLTYGHDAKLLPCHFWATVVGTASLLTYQFPDMLITEAQRWLVRVPVIQAQNAVITLQLQVTNFCFVILGAACSSHWVLCASINYCLLLAKHLPDHFMGPTSRRLESRSPVVQVEMEMKPKRARFQCLTHPPLLYEAFTRVRVFMQFCFSLATVAAPPPHSPLHHPFR